MERAFRVTERPESLGWEAVCQPTQEGTGRQLTLNLTAIRLFLPTQAAAPAAGPGTFCLHVLRLKDLQICCVVG
jgi:hypothetical protein